MDESLASKRNAPHIRKVQELSTQIFAVNSTLQYGAKASENDFGKTAEMTGLILRDVRSLYNNREMALVCTKLEEAIQWCEERNTTQIKIKLTEASQWCKSYVRVLSED